MHRAAAALILLTLALFLPACTHTYGLDVINKTEQTVRFELLTVKGDGSTMPFSNGILAPNGHFEEMVDDIKTTNGRRVLFSMNVIVAALTFDVIM